MMLRIQFVLAAFAISAVSFGQIHSFSGPIHFATINHGGGVQSQSSPWAFDNTTYSTGQFFAAGEADDLHMVAAGYLDSYKIGYTSPTGKTNCLVRFWASDPNDAIAVFIGQDHLTGLAQGTWVVTVNFWNPPTTMYLPKDIWMSQEYSATDAGALMYNPPTIGTSHNWFAQPNYGMPSYYWLFGGPEADFYEAVHVTPQMTGNVTLDSLAASTAGQSATLEFRTPNTTNVVYSTTITLDGSGNFAASNVPPGTYDVACKFSNWLRQVLHNVVVTAPTTSAVVNFSLTNGDAWSDNVVDLLDLSTILANFGSTGTPPIDGDVTWDGKVDLLDLSTILANFGMHGAP